MRSRNRYLNPSCSARDITGSIPHATSPRSKAGQRLSPIRSRRFYRLAVWPDLFGRALLARPWGRIGTQGRIRLDPHPDAGAAINALAQVARAKRRRGYRDGSA